MTKLPLICVCFLTVEFRVCAGGGVQTALEACTWLPVTVTPEKRDKATERKESSWEKEHPFGQIHPTQHCKEEEGAEFNASLGRQLGSNGKDSWVCSTTAVWPSYWQGLSTAAFACYAGLSPLNASSRRVPLQGVKCAKTLLFSLFKTEEGLTLSASTWEGLTIPLVSCSQELTDEGWERNCTLQRQLGVFKLHQLEKWLLNTKNRFIHGLVQGSSCQTDLTTGYFLPSAPLCVLPQESVAPDNPAQGQSVLWTPAVVAVELP